MALAKLSRAQSAASASVPAAHSRSRIHTIVRASGTLQHLEQPNVKTIPAEVEPLFRPIKMGRLELTNRMVMAPMTRCRAIDTMPQPCMATYYGQRAYPGSLLIAEGTIVSKEGQGYPHTPGIWSQEQVEAWRPIVQAVHDKGAHFYCQIWHVGRASHQAYQPNGQAPVSSSALAITSEEFRNVWTESEMAQMPVPQALDKEGIKQRVADHAAAARNAVAAGFDGVEVHAASGYLLDQFTKDSVNKRTDEYGGSIENRCRFALEVAKACVDAIGADRVGIRLSPFHRWMDATDSTPYATYVYLIEQLNKLGLAYVHMVEDRYQNFELADAPFSARSLDPFRKVCKAPFIVAGGYTRADAGAAVASGRADLVAFARQWLANPDLPRRYLLNAPLNKHDRPTFYTQDPVKGYTDYPALVQ